MRTNVWLVFIMIAGMHASSQTVCTGVVTGPGGKPLPLAHVTLLTPDAASVLQVVQAAPDGAYRVTLPRPGFWILRFAGVGYADHPVALYSPNRTPVQLNATLGCNKYFTGDLDLKVIGDFNLWNILNAVPMKRVGKGVYSAEIRTTSDSVTFRLRGCRDKESVEGVRNVTYTLTREGTYNARIKGSRGVVKITFDQSLLDRSGAPPSTDFVKATKRTRDVATAAAQWWKGDEDYLTAHVNAARKRKTLDTTMFDWRPRLAKLLEQAEASRDTLVRSVWALAYLSTALKAHVKDVAASTTCMEALASTSPTWALNPNALSFSIRNTSWAEPRREAYIQAALSVHPDRSVRVAVLFNEFTIAYLSEEKTKAAGYYDILTTQYADTPIGKMIREKYSRPGTGPQGKK